MILQQLKEAYPQVLVGHQFAVVVKERVNTYGAPGKLGERINPLIVVWTEDDENWSEIDSFDCSWLPEFVRLLQQAGSGITAEWPKRGPLMMPGYE